MDLDLALRTDKPASTKEQLNTANIEKWERPNRMYVMIIMHYILESFQGSITKSKNAKSSLLKLKNILLKMKKGKQVVF